MRFPRLRSTCPVVVSWVERFYPQLTGALVPIVPPYIAQARLVRALSPSDTAIVYVSPCWARKDEIFEPKLAGVVDVAIGFDELKALLAEEPVSAAPRSTTRRQRAGRSRSRSSRSPTASRGARSPSAT